MIAEAFEAYRQDVISADAPEIQVRECRRAFYAGAQGFFAGVLCGFDDDHEPTEDDLLLMDNVHRELLDFAADVVKGLA